MADGQRDDEDKAPMKKHWLATPKPFIAWGAFMGLGAGATFLVLGLAAFREGLGGVETAYMVLTALFPPVAIGWLWWMGRD